MNPVLRVAPMSVCTKLGIACKKTLSNRANAIAIGAIAAGVALSSSFRSGLITAPVSMISSIAICMLAASEAGRKIFDKIRIPLNIPNRVGEFTARHLPESNLTSTVIVPVIEEVIFRGAIQTAAVAALGPVPGVALSALAFSAVHVDPNQPHQPYNAFLGGVILGVLKEKFSLLASIGHHMGQNAFWGPFLGFSSPDNGFIRNYLEAQPIS